MAKQRCKRINWFQCARGWRLWRAENGRPVLDHQILFGRTRLIATRGASFNSSGRKAHAPISLHDACRPGPRCKCYVATVGTFPEPPPSRYCVVLTLLIQAAFARVSLRGEEVPGWPPTAGFFPAEIQCPVSLTGPRAEWARTIDVGNLRSFKLFCSARIGIAGNNMKKQDRELQQAREVQENQAALRRSIAETARLVDESEAMLRRHKAERERDEDED